MTVSSEDLQEAHNAGQEYGASGQFSIFAGAKYILFEATEDTAAREEKFWEGVENGRKNRSE